MAHGVTRQEPFRVHQALHGYAEGHRLLAASTAFKARDAKLILTLSDASGSTSTADSTGYLTGYPLPDTGQYAIAKTWPASEMPRPGCVWTHTLLIDFADLAAIPSLDVFSAAFRRPQPGEDVSVAYGGSIVVEDPGEISTRLREDCLPLVRRLLWALYTRPGERIVSGEGTPEHREAAVLSILSQQWPRLRRSFRFCTLAFSDRSSDLTPFDLQFAPPNDRSARSRFSKLHDADREQAPTAEWLSCALNDLVFPEDEGLHSFLREAGAQLDGGRELFEPMCRFYSALRSKQGNVAIGASEALALVNGTLGVGKASAFRSRLAEFVVRHAGEMKSPELVFALHNLDSLGPELRSDAVSRVGAALWVQEPGHLGDWLAGHGTPQTRAMEAFSSVSTEVLLEGLRRRPDLLPQVVESRPSLLRDSGFWAAGGELAVSALEGVRGDPDTTRAALESLLAIDDLELIKRACRVVGASRVLSVVLKRLDERHALEPSAAEGRWLSAATEPNIVATALSDGSIREVTTLAALAGRMGPDDVPNDFGEDPWLIACRSAQGRLGESDRVAFAAWLLVRGLGRRTRNSGQLLAQNFEDVYLAALASRLPERHWSLLSQRLPEGHSWEEWDRGRRLRVGLVNAFVERDLDPGLFGQLMKSDDLFSQLALEMENASWGGSRYLRRARRALKSLDSNRFASRVDLLNRLT